MKMGELKELITFIVILNLITVINHWTRKTILGEVWFDANYGILSTRKNVFNNQKSELFIIIIEILER